MISVYTINYPAAACVLMLLFIGLYHLFMSRRQEFQSTVLSSSLNLLSGDHPFSLATEDDLVVNCLLVFDRIRCKRLFLGPKAVLNGKIIEASEVVIEGTLQSVETVIAYREVQILKNATIGKIETPRLVLGRHSIVTIQIVPAATRVVRKRGSNTRGFFTSLDELQRSKRKVKRSAPDAPRKAPTALLAEVRPIHEERRGEVTEIVKEKARRISRGPFRS